MKRKKNKNHDRVYSLRGFFRKFGSFLVWLVKDIIHILKFGRKFNEFGLTAFCGRQGGGKTMAMVEYLERMRHKYPNVKIITNFGYKFETKPMEDWRDLLEFRNGEDGVIFAIDEIQNEYNSNSWKDFPETLLSEITQQRKQRVKIICSSQVYTRMVKQLREQCFEVVECKTLFGRWTFCRMFDAEEYNLIIDNPEKRNKIHRLKRWNFVQDNNIRELYDSYAKVERLKRMTFIERDKRMAQ